MLSRSPSTPARLSQRAQAQRRLRRSATRRPFCSTNGCTTYMDLDAGGRHAICPICGLHRRIAPAAPAVAAARLD